MAAGQLCKILIVDDEILIRQGIKHYLDWEKEGFVIVGEASNGQEALEVIEGTDPHIILTDIVMPIMDGEELTKIVKKKYPQIEIIILSSFGEFDYVRSAFQSGVVDYILKPKLDGQSLLKVLKSAASKIPAIQDWDKEGRAQLSIRHIIHKLISGYEVNYEVESITNVFPKSHYCLVGFDLKRHPDKNNAELLSALKKKIEFGIEVYLGKTAYYSFTYEQNILVYLLNINSDNKKDVLTLAQQATGYEPGIGVVLTEEFEDFSRMGIVFKTSLLKLIDYRFYLSKRSSLFKQDLPEPPSCDTFNLDWFTSEMKRKHFDSAFDYLLEHVAALSKCYTFDIFEYKSFFGNIIFNITILLGNMEYDVKELESSKYTYFNSIDDVSTAEEAVQLLKRFIAEVHKCLVAMPNQQENINMRKLQEYIIDHYAEQITLTEVAKHFHFNPSYLSSYFSTHNKEGFIEYVNKIRIEEATKLLIHEDISISEISSMVGYSDHSYFCKVFKKMKGLSPSQYKRKHKLS
ncbi:response regulator [Neobacillus sp. NPDC058068]|uniref:response regulator transcription factor n=1 Tax=Neobacillus sp. NPDC058068 TaxID=3346325 RepID=UPI0036DD3824